MPVLRPTTPKFKSTKYFLFKLHFVLYCFDYGPRRSRLFVTINFEQVKENTVFIAGYYSVVPILFCRLR